MFDELHGTGKGTFDFGGGSFEFETAIRSHTGMQTIWVHALHWPRCCECDGTHSRITFGEGRFGGKFLIAHLDFWLSTDLQVREIETEINQWLYAGDLPDWVPQPQA
jgi:hypothetical protein